MNSLLAPTRFDWLGPHRARAYAISLALFMAAFLAWVGALSLLHWAAKPVALDFSAFWAAAHLAVAGHAAAAYDPAVIEPVERGAALMAPGYLAFYYPPSFLLVLLPLGLLGYGTALALFLATEMLLALTALRCILPQRWAWLPMLSFPGFFMNGLSGQNAPLSVACLASACIWLERAPLLAGACLGALSCKPQLAVCVPAALLSARRWRALTGFLFSTCLLALISLASFGAKAWQGFVQGTALARADVETLSLKWPKMQSVFGAVRLLGGGNTAAYAAQISISLAALLLLVRICSLRPGPLLEISALAAAALLFTPFLYDYDLAILAVPLTCLAALAQQTGWRSFEQPFLAATFLLPLLARPAGLLFGITLGPAFVLALLFVVARRSLQTAHVAR